MKYLNYSLLIIAITILSFGNTVAQVDSSQSEFEKYKQEIQNEFEDFSKKSQQEFEAFKSENDSLFLEYLENSWREFKLYRSERIVKPKPDLPPKVSENENQKEEKPENELPKDSIIDIIEDTIQIENKENNEQTKADSFEIDEKKLEEMTEETISTEEEIIEENPIDTLFNNSLEDIQEKPTENEIKEFIRYFGLEIPIFYSKNEVRNNETISQEYINNYFDFASSNQKLCETSISLKQTADSLDLNDWAFIVLLKKASEKFFDNSAQQRLFVWFAMLKNNFDVKIGFSNQKVFLLCHSQEKMYSTNYYEFENKKYYIVPFGDKITEFPTIISHEASYPTTTKNVSFRLDKLPILGNKTITRTLQFRDNPFDVQFNQNLIDFYSTYPAVELSVYFSSPLSKLTINTFDESFKKYLSNKTEAEKVDILLEFMHYSIDYKKDDKQFGYEKWMFADECLYFPYADCEDRSVLFAQLVKNYTNFDIVGLDYIDHIATAINLSNKTGDFVLLYEKKYYICDPTYIGAKTGMIMIEYKNMTPKVINFN
ncbi:MAG: hypothetical protein HN894_15555 [Bacteroidetes bacterium]|jgi:hypothetical protein|nr:hypothetical protein [Bacteroidota bacterium]